MNRMEIAEVTKNHWRTYYPQAYRNLKTTGKLETEALAAADLTLMEMDVLIKTYRMSSLEAWTESRHLFCLKDPTPN